MSDDYYNEVRIDSIVELTEVLMKDTMALIKKHGIDDPNMNAIVTAGYVTAITKLTRVLPNLSFVVASLLTENMMKEQKK
jgi:hypothetical protein